MTLIYAIIALGILIFVHELGHFLVAKLFKVKVEKFSLGFGPKLYSKQIGETEYLLSAFPLGGYVKMFGESGIIEGDETALPTGEDSAATAEPGREYTDEEKKRSFFHRPPLARILIVMAGPVFNLLFAWLVFIILSMTGVPTLTTKIGDVPKDKPAFKAGIQQGDVIKDINGKPVTSWNEVASLISGSKGQPVTLIIRRDKNDLTFNITPEARVSKNLFGEEVQGFAIGVASAGEIVTEYYEPIQAFYKGTAQTYTVIDLTVMSLVKLIQRVVPLDTVGGPIMIVKMAGEQAAAGASSFLAFMALLSVNLGILNLLPVPVLDGGHLMFYFWELVTRRPVSQKIREYGQQIGMALLLCLMVLAFYNDIIRYFTEK